MVKAIPDGYHTLTPYLVVGDAAKAIEFCRKAFGATEIMRMVEPGGKRIMHAELMVGDSRLMLSDTYAEMGGKNPKDLKGTPVTVHVYSEDADALAARAAKAGAKIIMPVAEMFWGDRFGKVKDPFGHGWSIATHVKDLTPAQFAKAAAAAFEQHEALQKKAPARKKATAKKKATKKRK